MNTDPRLTDNEREYVIEDKTDVSTWFSLSYSNYQVLHRTLLEGMPLEWQHRFVDLMEELEDAYSHVKTAEGYQVQAGTWHYPDDLSRDRLEALGWAIDEADPDDEDDHRPTVYYDPEGNEHTGYHACVFIPCEDPIPHYREGLSPDMMPKLGDQR